MAKAKVRKPKNVVERNIRLVGNLMQFLFKQPQLLDSLPQDFELVILPDDDPEMRLYNLELLNSYDRAEKPVVFARIKSSEESVSKQVKPSLYVPISL